MQAPRDSSQRVQLYSMIYSYSFCLLPSQFVSISSPTVSFDCSKSDELLGKLIIKLQEEGKDVASPATTPQPVAKTSARRKPSAPSTASPRRKTLDPSVMQRAVNTPVTATAPRRKSVDSSVLQRAMDTPLPPPTAAFKTPRTPPSAVQQPPAAAQPSRSTPSLITLFAIFVLMYAVGLNAPRAAKYIRQYDYGTGIGNLQIDVKQVYGAAAEWTRTTAGKGVESVKYYKAVADEQSRKLAREASLKIQEFVSLQLIYFNLGCALNFWMLSESA